jgi:hypothetical protein
MEQNTKSAQRRAPAGCAYLLVAGWLTYGKHFIFEQLVRFPLITVALGAVWVIGWDWRLIILLPLVILCSLLTAPVASLQQTKQVVQEIAHFYDQFQHCRFVPLTLGEYLEAVYQDSPERADTLDEKGEQGLRESMLPDSEYFFGGHIRFIVVDAGQTEGPGLGMAVAYPAISRAWIFLNDHPRNMRGFQKFAMLHEAGHTEAFGSLDYSLKGSSIPVLMALPVIAIMVEWDVTTLLILIAVLLVLLWANLESKRQSKYARLHDEMYADLFAFKKCRKEWLGNFPASKIAEVICRTVKPSAGQADAELKFDAPLTEEQEGWRREAFIGNIERVRKGEQPTNQDVLPLNLFLKRANLIRLSQTFLLAALLVMLGLQHGELTTMRFVGLILVLLSLMFIGIACNLADTMMLNFWDKKFGTKELSPVEQKNLDTFVKGSQTATRFYEKQQRLKDKVWRQEPDGQSAEDYLLAPGTTGRLFLPDELAIRVDKQTLEACIYHEKVIDYDVSHLVYLPEDHSIVVVMNDQTRLDLGTKLTPPVRAHFIKAKEVRIVRTKDQKAVDEITVPLWRVG